MELENKEICRKCGGTCCKETGCYYSSEDLKVVDARSVIDLLDKGYTSIVSDVFIMRNNPILLSLRARNRNAGKIDLVSCSSWCTALTDTGCIYSFEDRPSGGRYLIPYENGRCCYNQPKLIDIADSWQPYQQMLKRVCEEVSGIEFDELMRIQVQEYFEYLYQHQMYDHDNFTEYRILFPQEDKKALQKVFGINDDDSLETKISKMF